jgi:hypothetical protein
MTLAAVHAPVPTRHIGLMPNQLEVQLRLLPLLQKPACELQFLKHLKNEGCFDCERFERILKQNAF